MDDKEGVTENLTFVYCTQNENANHLDFMIDQIKVHQQKSKRANRNRWNRKYRKARPAETGERQRERGGGGGNHIINAIFVALYLHTYKAISNHVVRPFCRRPRAICNLFGRKKNPTNKAIPNLTQKHFMRHWQEALLSHKLNYINDF